MPSEVAGNHQKSASLTKPPKGVSLNQTLKMPSEVAGKHQRSASLTNPPMVCFLRFVRQIHPKLQAFHTTWRVSQWLHGSGSMSTSPGMPQAVGLKRNHCTCWGRQEGACTTTVPKMGWQRWGMPTRQRTEVAT